MASSRKAMSADLAVCGRLSIRILWRMGKVLLICFLIFSEEFVRSVYVFSLLFLKVLVKVREAESDFLYLPCFAK